MKNILKDNKGASLLEVMVIIAIMAVLGASTLSYMGYLVRGDIKKATKTVYSAISSTQTLAKARTGEWVFSVDVDAEGLYNLVTTTYDVEPDGSLINPLEVDRIKLEQKVTGINVNQYSADGTAISADPFSSMTFVKNTGAVKAINGTNVVNGGYCEIEINISGNYKFIRVYYLTGKIE